jgi:hypothetical protein
MVTVFHLGQRVRLTDQARASGLGAGVELATVCRACNPTALNVRVVWDRHGARRGLYVSRDLIQPAAGGNKA